MGSHKEVFLKHLQFLRTVLILPEKHVWNSEYIKLQRDV